MLGGPTFTAAVIFIVIHYMGQSAHRIRIIEINMLIQEFEPITGLATLNSDDTVNILIFVPFFRHLVCPSYFMVEKYFRRSIIFKRFCHMPYFCIRVKK